jgi:predicted metal-dependent phosphoesterase TrpH
MLFDHHVHSRYSVLDSSSKVEDIIRRAKEMGLGAIAVSDHDEIRGSLEAVKSSGNGLIAVSSTEVSSNDGHIVALGVKERIESGLSAKETIKRIHKLGGIAIAAHPYDRIRSGVGDLCWKLDFDAIEINGHCLYGNGYAEDAARAHGKPLVGGSDAHSVGEIGTICTEVEGSTPEEIIRNIKAGRCEVVYTRNILSLKANILTGKISRRLFGRRSSEL